MNVFARFALAAGLALALAAPFAETAAAEPSFSHTGIAADAKRYEAYLQSSWKASAKKAPELKLEADKLFATDPRAASRLLANVVAGNANDGPAWTRLAEALLAIKPDPEKSERYDLPVNASGAAYRGYQLAKDKAEKAHALSVLGTALQQRSYWRPAIDSLKLSIDLVDDQPTREAYDKLRAEHGFRMLDYKTDNETTPPRLCLQFSEDLSRAQTDVAKFIAVDGKDPQTLTQEGKQLCVEGLTHGQRYQVTIRQGLPSEVRENLNKTSEIAVYVPDRSALVRFTGKSYVLPSRGQQGIPVVTTNTSRIAVEVHRIGDRNLATLLQSGDFQRQLSDYEIENIRNNTGVKVYSGEMDVPSKLNEDVTTAVPVTDATGALEPGAYVLTAKPTEKIKGDSYQIATQWFIVSDLGLTAFTGGDGVHAFVRSLADATAIGDAKVKLVARNNEVLATAATDSNGYVKFDSAIAKGEGGAQPAVLIAEKGAGEYAFLDLTLNAFDLSDRGVKGRDAAGPVDGYVYTERGVYRGGEEVAITALVRDAKGKALSLPTTLIVTRPDGVEHARVTLNDQGLGGRSHALSLAKTAQTGTWRLYLHADPKQAAVAERAFLVEDFVPERLDMTIASDAPAMTPEAETIVKADGKYLYGPPAANLGLEGEIVVRPATKDLAGYAGYQFGQSDEFINPVRENLSSGLVTDKDGKAAIAVTLPQIEKTARPLEAELLVKLVESGGRAIERKLILPIDLKQPRIGIKPLFEAGQAPEDQDAGFEIVLLGPDGKPQTSDKLNWTLTRLDQNWQWYRRDGNWTYDSVTTKRKVGGGALSLTAEAPAKITQPLGWGKYRLDVASTEPNGPASSVTFNAGWYASGENVDSPEQLDVALDKASYKSGETAKLRVSSKLGGTALIAVLGDKLHLMQTVDIAKGGGEVEIPVADGLGAGAYVTALVYRPMDEASKRMPGRAIGVAWLGVDSADRELKVGLTLPDKLKSGSKLTVPVKVEGLASGEDARITVAAVDLGILNLTRFEAPAPEKWFNAQQKLSFEIRDFYGRLIDGMRADRGKLKSGGDGSGPVMQGNPTVETVVSLYSGIVKVGADGTANVEFDIPDFNGTVRVMAVAWSGDKTGHGQADVIVRDSVALTVAVPRFMTFGDEVNLGFDVHNIDGPEGAYKIALAQVQGDSSSERITMIADKSPSLKTGDKTLERFAFKPKDDGQITLRVAVTGPGAIAVKRDMTFDVFPPANDIKRTTISSIKANGGKLTVSRDLVADMIASRTKINLSVGPTARLDVPSLLTQLDRYPYGCAEQTVSRALPLVYANAVAAQLGIAEDKALKERVQGAVNRVFEMQDFSGAFGVWGPSTVDLWLTAYVTDFLTRAKENGANVPAEGFARALERLQNFLSYAEDFEKGGEDRAYAIYVLARNGRAPIGELRYFADERLERFSTALAKAQIGAALAMMGDKERAERAFAAAMSGMEEASPDSGYRADYGSTLRDGAALVTLAAENGIAKADAPKLASVIAKAYETRSYTSTQEQAWMLLAAKALNDEAKETTLTVNGQKVKGPTLRSLVPADLQNGELTITNDGDAATDAVISVIGAALTPEPPVSKGFKIERTAYTLDGKKADLKSLSGGQSSVKQNDRFVIVVKVSSEEAGGRVLIVDRLPAGFEIENPHLVSSGSVAGLDFVKSTVDPEHTEFRDDRFVAAFNFSGGSSSSSDDENASSEGESDAPAALESEPSEDATAADAAPPAATATVAYIVRAVTPGAFVHPAATVEDMYRPERYARTAAGKLTVGMK